MAQVGYNGMAGGAGKKVRIDVPLSKSIAARALILNYIRGDNGGYVELPDCSDTRELANAIALLKRHVPSLPEHMRNWEGGREIYIKDGFDMGNGGTSLRFFLALVASIPGLKAEIRCSEQLRKRPLSPLIDALRKFGAGIDCLGREGCAPMIVKGNVLSGGFADLPGTITSQYLSALLLVQSLWSGVLIYNAEGQVSKPYLSMTERMVNEGGDLLIERDWSAAANFYEMVLLAQNLEIEIAGLLPPGKSMQGDSKCAELFEEVGVHTCFNGEKVSIKADPVKICELSRSGCVVSFDMGGNPDLVPPLAVGMAMAGIRFELHNVGTLKYKESDRLHALISELAKFGFVLTVEGDALCYRGESRGAGAEITVDCRCDHRLSMAFAAAVIKTGKVTIDEKCVEKSFPDFFEQAEKAGIVMSY